MRKDEFILEAINKLMTIEQEKQNLQDELSEYGLTIEDLSDLADANMSFPTEVVETEEVEETEETEVDETEVEETEDELEVENA